MKYSTWRGQQLVQTPTLDLPHLAQGQGVRRRAQGRCKRSGKVKKWLGKEVMFCEMTFTSQGRATMPGRSTWVMLWMMMMETCFQGSTAFVLTGTDPACGNLGPGSCQFRAAKCGVVKELPGQERPREGCIASFLTCVRSACIQQMPPDVANLPIFSYSDDDDDDDHKKKREGKEMQEALTDDEREISVEYRGHLVAGEREKRETRASWWSMGRKWQCYPFPATQLLDQVAPSLDSNG
ncbi:hypothetical protein Hamer_G005034, partial [Homarus americanus]